MSQSQASAPSRDSIATWLVQWIAKELGLTADVIEPDKSLLDYSLSSVTAMMLVGDVEEWLGLTLPPTLVWDYPSIAAIANFLSEQLAAPPVAGAEDLGIAASAGPVPVAAIEAMSDQEVTALLNRLIAEDSAGAALC